MTTVVIGTADPNLASDLSGILEEQGDFEIGAVLDTPEELVERVRRGSPVVALVDENLGPQPMAVVVGELSRRSPGTSVLVISTNRTPDKLVQAMAAGARGVIGYPFTYEDVATQLDTAIGWANSMRSVLEGSTVATGRRGTVVPVVGAKGGVGTTTIATHIALDHLNEHPEARVCLVDADVEKGDVSALLEVRQAVSIANVARVSDDMTTQTVRDALVHHETGLHLLLAPVDVRESEYVTPEALRAIIELLQREFDLVVIDGGGHVSPTQAAVIEAVGAAVVVTTADVLAVRAMRKRMQAWEALGVTNEAACRVLVNQVDKASLFPSSAVGKLTTAKVLSTVIPLSPRVLEQAINDRDPRSVTESGWWKLISKLRSEIGLSQSNGAAPTPEAEVPRKGRRRFGRASSTEESVPEIPTGHEIPTGQQPPTGPQPPAPAAPSPGPSMPPHPSVNQVPPPPPMRQPSVRAPGERGAVALENAVMIPLALLMAVICWQLAVIGVTFIYAGHATGAATREYSISGSTLQAQAEARSSVPTTFGSGLDVSSRRDTVTVRMDIPSSFNVPGMPQELSMSQDVVREP